MRSFLVLILIYSSFAQAKKVSINEHYLLNPSDQVWEVAITHKLLKAKTVFYLKRSKTENEKKNAALITQFEMIIPASKKMSSAEFFNREACALNKEAKEIQGSLLGSSNTAVKQAKNEFNYCSYSFQDGQEWVSQAYFPAHLFEKQGTQFTASILNAKAKTKAESQAILKDLLSTGSVL